MRPLQRIDTVPMWIREALLDEKVSAMTKTSVKATFIIPTSGAKPSEVEANLYSDEPTSKHATITIQYKGLPAERSCLYEKTFSNLGEAEKKWKEITSKLGQYSSFKKNPAGIVPEGTTKETSDFILELEADSDRHPTGSGSKVMGSFAPGWDIVANQNQLLVSFSKDFLKKAFSKFNKVEDVPVEAGEQVYSTSTRQHVGADNFVISHWKKARTADGNIIRNTALISRLSGESYCVSDVSVDEYNQICSYLTPNPADYGISYDSVTSSWNRSNVDVTSNLKGLVAMVVERISGTPEEIAEYDALKKEKGAGASPLEGEMPSPDKSKSKGKSGSEEKSLPLGEELSAPAVGAEGELPGELPGGASSGTASEEDLMKLLQKEASSNSEEN